MCYVMTIVNTMYSTYVHQIEFSPLMENRIRDSIQHGTIKILFKNFRRRCKQESQHNITKGRATVTSHAKQLLEHHEHTGYTHAPFVLYAFAAINRRISRLMKLLEMFASEEAYSSSKRYIT